MFFLIIDIEWLLSHVKQDISSIDHIHLLYFLSVKQVYKALFVLISIGFMEVDVLIEASVLNMSHCES